MQAIRFSIDPKTFQRYIDWHVGDEKLTGNQIMSNPELMEELTQAQLEMIYRMIRPGDNPLTLEILENGKLQIVEDRKVPSIEFIHSEIGGFEGEPYALLELPRHWTYSDITKWLESTDQEDWAELLDNNFQCYGGVAFEDYVVKTLEEHPDSRLIRFEGRCV